MYDTSNALVIMGSHSVTCHPTGDSHAFTPQRIAGTHLSTPEG